MNPSNTTNTATGEKGSSTIDTNDPEYFIYLIAYKCPIKNWNVPGFTKTYTE